MYQVKRISKTPATAFRIAVDSSQGDGDAGFQQGGVFYFEPAGTEGDTHQVGEAAAKAIMHDPGLAEHFTCFPEYPPKDPAPEQVANPGGTSGPRQKRRDAAGG